MGLGRMEASGPPVLQCCFKHLNRAPPPPTPPALLPVPPDPLQLPRTQGLRWACGYWELRGGYRGIWGYCRRLCRDCKGLWVYKELRCTPGGFLGLW